MEAMKVYPKHPNLLSMGTLSGDKVISPHEEELGKIEDFVIDIRPGQVAYIILSFVGALGVGDRFFAVPWNALELNTDKHAFVLNIDKDVLKSAPGFDRNSWPNMSSRDWGERIYAYYGQKPYWSSLSEEPLTEMTGETKRPTEAKGIIVPEKEAAEPGSLPPARVLVEEARPEPSMPAAGDTTLARGSALKGLRVRNMQREELGRIDEIMIELETGKIAYAVLSFGGVLGVASKLFAVPWNALGIDFSNREFVLNIPRKSLVEAPGFDKDNWPGVEGGDWSEKESFFYGQPSSGLQPQR